MKACWLECARSHQPLTEQAAEQVPRHGLQWAGHWARQQEPEVSPSFSHSEGRAESLGKLQGEAATRKVLLVPQLLWGRPLNGGTIGSIAEGIQ